MKTIETLLYYPTVAVPREWAKTALFNGYSVGSITPRDWYSSQRDEFIFNPSFNEMWPQGASNYYLSRNEVEELSSNDLFKKFDPTGRNQDYNGFEDEFLGIIESEGFKELLNQKKEFSNIPAEERHKQSWIHRDKISMNIIEYLVKKKLALKTPKKDRGMDYYIVDNTISDLYMSLLSQNIADNNSYPNTPGILPSSEKIDHWKNLSNPSYSINKQACINVLINGGALSPVPGTPIESIISFRDDHRRECFKYQRKLFKIVKDVSQKHTWDAIPAVMQDEVREILVDLDALEQDLDQLKIQCRRNAVFLSVAPIASLGASIMEGLGTGSFPTWELIDRMVDGLSAIIAPYISYRRDRIQRLDDSPSTYLYLANTQGIGNISLN